MYCLMDDWLVLLVRTLFRIRESQIINQVILLLLGILRSTGISVEVGGFQGESNRLLSNPGNWKGVIVTS